LTAISERRGLLLQLVKRDFHQRFIGSAAGWLWAVIHPLVLLLSWVFVFQWCLKIPLPRGEVTQNYTMFLFCGYLPWLLFSETVTRSASSLLDHSNLVTKTLFPAEIVPVSIFFSSLLNHFLALALVVAAIGLRLQHFSVMMVLLAPYIVFIGLFAVGIGWMAASLHVYLRDTAQVLTVVLTFWFWITPIFISEELFPPEFRFLIRANPMSYVVRAYRDHLLSSRPPDLAQMATFALCALAAFTAGALVFRHLKRGFADVL
jgi:ABC-type polysaccharide/polyol phosphate export permease